MTSTPTHLTVCMGIKFDEIADDLKAAAWHKGVLDPRNENFDAKAVRLEWDDETQTGVVTIELEDLRDE